MDPDLGIIKYPDKDQQYNSVAESELKIFMSNMSSYVKRFFILFYFPRLFSVRKMVGP